MDDTVRAAATPRWRGQAGRLEVWYATLSDPVTRAGLWVHHEMVSPAGGAGLSNAPYRHGWVTWFPAQGSPSTQRFGPEAVDPAADPSAPKQAWFTGAGTRLEHQYLTGRAGPWEWALQWTDTGPPLWTFPRTAWEHELLPGAQVVLAPSAEFTGAVTVGGTAHRIDGWRGAVSHIYGHGNARCWGWIHADLGRGDTLEVVTAASLKPGLRRLAPIAFIRFRIDGTDWPARGFPALRMRTTLGVRHWQLEGGIGRRRVLIRVDQPAERCVSLGYTDPDGATAVCTNTEQADVHVEIDDRSWSVLGTGHAEVGLRGAQAPAVDERIPS